MKRITPAIILCLYSAINAESAAAVADVRFSEGLKIINTCCPSYWLGVNGRLEFDEVAFGGKAYDRQGNFPTGGTIRRGFIAIHGGAGDCFTYNLTLDFGKSSSRWIDLDIFAGTGLVEPPRTRSAYVLSDTITHGVTLIEEAWLGYSGLWDCTCLRLGQFTPLTTMDGYTNYGTTSNQMFLESALATMAFDVPSYIQSSSRAMKGFGIILNTEICDLVTLGATVYQPAHSPQNVYGDTRRSDRLGSALRVTYSPVHECDYALHAGFLARYQSLNHTDASRTLTPESDAIINTLFFTTPEVLPRNYIGNAANFSSQVNGIPNGFSVYQPTLVDTGAIRSKSFNHLAWELAGVWGPFTAQGEYHRANVQRLPFSNAIVQPGNVQFYGWHVQGGYVLTGESRGYNFSQGSLGTIKPCSAWGAFEIAARYSYVNLMDKDVYGGAANNLTLGLNWYANDNIKFALNYLNSHITPTGFVAGQQPLVNNSAKRKLDIVAARIQVIF